MVLHLNKEFIKIAIWKIVFDGLRVTKPLHDQGRFSMQVDEEENDSADLALQRWLSQDQFHSQYLGAVLLCLCIRIDEVIQTISTSHFDLNRHTFRPSKDESLSKPCK